MSELPKEWKQGKTSAIFKSVLKKGRTLQTNMSNKYIMQIMEHCVKCNLSYDDKFGFIKGRYSNCQMSWTCELKLWIEETYLYRHHENV